MTIKWTFLWTSLRLKGMVCKKLAQHRETTMQSSNMYLAAFQHTIYDNHVFVLLFFTKQLLLFHILLEVYQ